MAASPEPKLIDIQLLVAAVLLIIAKSLSSGVCLVQSTSAWTTRLHTRSWTSRSLLMTISILVPLTAYCIGSIGLFATGEQVPQEYVEPLDEANIITSSFLVRLDNNHSPERAHNIAKRNGFVSLGPVAGSRDHYQFHHPQIKERKKRSVRHLKQLKRDPNIVHAIQQAGFRRDKRGFKSLPKGPPAVNNDAHRDSSIKSAAASMKDPTDPYFKYQWPLKNVGQNGGKPNLDLNVEEAWAKGYTGKNVTTAIMDDGVDYMHLDLRENYNAKASYDFSSNDKFPYPRYTDDWFNSHGTRCAGEIVSKRDNGICGVGVAYDSKVAGIRMLDQPYMTDIIEANSMSHEPNLVDIYSASWGPTDNGKTVDGPRNATMHAIVRGVNEGRNGKGSIYVWASGDGGQDDDCNCDGYAASMWTISINSAINTGENAHYDESCSSTLASTFSNGAKDPHTGVATTDLYDRCTQTHSGTSAAAPEAAGVYALALEANPNLTWRDIQHLTVLTSKRNSLYDGKGRFNWKTNGVGLEFNHLFGYGVLDAGSMVTLAKDWKTVPSRYHCDAGSVTGLFPIPVHNTLELNITTDACKGTSSEVNYIEHVQAIITLNATIRGDLIMYLTSPMGTKSMILNRRPNDDDSKNGFIRWPFMTTHTWAENPRGRWKLEVKFYSESSEKNDNTTNTTENEINDRNTTKTLNDILNNKKTSGRNGQQKGKRVERRGFIKEWRLMLHGTSEPPYKNLEASDSNSKLAIVKKAHGE